MKKLAFYLIALTVSAAVGFAQTAPAATPAPAAPAAAATPAAAAADPVASVTGGLYTGVVLGHTDANNWLYQYDYWNQGVQNEEWIDIYYTAGNYGFEAEFSNGDTTNTTAGTVSAIATFDQMEVWGKFLDNKVKVEVGFIGNNDYTTVGDHAGAGWCGWAPVGGVLFNLYPIDGLKIGYWQPVASAGASQQGNYLYGSGNSDNTLTDAWKNAAFGIVYSVPKTYKVQAELENSPNGVSINGSFKVSGIKNVALSAEAYLNNLGNSNVASVLHAGDGYKSTNANAFNQVAGYHFDDLYIGGVFTEYKFNDISNVGYTLGFEPSYTVGPVTYTLEAIYKSLVDGNAVVTTGYDFSAYAKWVADDHLTVWLGFDYTNAAVANAAAQPYDTAPASHTVVTTPTFSIPLSVQYSF